MTIAVDKNSLSAIKKGNEYVYLFNNESYEELKALNMHCIYYKNCQFVDINLTNYDINCLKEAKPNENDWDKLPEKKDYKIGIIMPNCNYAEWLNESLGSIANQTYRNFEVIFIDDMSTDNSVAIAKSYQDKMNIKVVELKQKRLNGGARNEGYLYLSNDVDYVWYVDSDDWLIDEHALELINQRLIGYPDVLFVGISQSINHKISIARTPDYKDKYEAMLGWSGSCGKVIKKSLATRQECLYNEGTLKEDKNQHCKICIYMNNFKVLKNPVYVWNRDNHKSVTTIRDKAIWGTSTIRHYADTLQLYLTEQGKDARIDQILEGRVNQMKLEIDKSGDKQW